MNRGVSVVDKILELFFGITINYAKDFSDKVRSYFIRRNIIIEDKKKTKKLLKEFKKQNVDHSSNTKIDFQSFYKCIMSEQFYIHVNQYFLNEKTLNDLIEMAKSSFNSDDTCVEEFIKSLVEIRRNSFEKTIDIKEKYLNEKIITKFDELSPHFKKINSTTEEMHNDIKKLSDDDFQNRKRLTEYTNSRKVINNTFFSTIHFSFKIDNIDFEFNREKETNDLKNLTKGSVAIIHGIGGVGKSALIKKTFYDNENIYYVFKATEFSKTLEDIFKNTNIEEFCRKHDNVEQKYIIIDAAEKLLDINTTEEFYDFLKIVTDNKWIVLITTRTIYLNDLKQFFYLNAINDFKEIEVQTMPESEVKQLLKKYSKSEMDSNLVDLLRIPFYLNFFFSLSPKEEKLSLSEFKEMTWDTKIKKSSPNREGEFISIVLKKASDNSVFLENTRNSEFTDFVNEGLIVDENSVYYLSHDIFEEWAIEKYFNNRFIRTTSIEEFFSQIQETLQIRRGLRIWLKSKILNADQKFEQFIIEVFLSDEAEFIWKNEVMVAVLLSPFSEKYFAIIENNLLDINKISLINDISKKLLICCKKIDVSRNSSYGFTDDFVLFTQPQGNGWSSFIELVYFNNKLICKDSVINIVNVIHDWNYSNKSGEITRKASMIALTIFNLINNDKGLKVFTDLKDKLAETIIMGLSEIQEEFKLLIDGITNENIILYDIFIDKILINSVGSKDICEIMPQSVIDLFWKYFKISENEKNKSYNFGYEYETDYKYGLKDTYNSLYPASPYMTPTFFLLVSDFMLTLDFIISFVNEAVHNYKDELDTVEIIMPDGEIVKQFGNYNLWSTYRMNNFVPDVLVCMHTALEKYLLDNYEKIGNKEIRRILLYILKNTNSISLTAVVMSIVLFKPSEMSEISIILLSSLDVINYDNYKIIRQNELKGSYSIANYPRNSIKRIYVEERLKTFDDEFRKITFENQILNYLICNELANEEEFNKRKDVIYKVLDKHYESLDKSKVPDTDSRRYILARIDLRKMNFEEKDNRILISSTLTKAQIEDKKKREEDDRDFNEWLNFRSNINKLIENNNINEDFDFKAILEKIKHYYQSEDSEFRIDIDTLIKACYLYLDNCVDVTDEQYELIKEIVFTSIYKEVISLNRLRCEHTHTIKCLEKLHTNNQLDQNDFKLILIFCSLIDDIDNFLKKSAISYIQNSSNLDRYFLVELYYKIVQKYNEKMQVHKLEHEYKKENCMEEIINEIEQIYSEDETVINVDNMTLQQQYTYVLLRMPNNISDDFSNICKIFYNFFNAVETEEKKYTGKRVLIISALEKYAEIALFIDEKQLNDYLNISLIKIKNNTYYSQLFKYFIILNNENRCDLRFWQIWNKYLEKASTTSKVEYSRIDDTILSYLFFNTPENISFINDNNIVFFNNFSKKINYSPSAVLALSSLARNKTDGMFFQESIKWISILVSKSNTYPLYFDEPKEMISYLEEYMILYVAKFGALSKKDQLIRKNIIEVLNFLIQYNSCRGYILLDRIL